MTPGFLASRHPKRHPFSFLGSKGNCFLLLRSNPSSGPRERRLGSTMEEWLMAQFLSSNAVNSQEILRPKRLIGKFPTRDSRSSATGWPHHARGANCVRVWPMAFLRVSRERIFSEWLASRKRLKKNAVAKRHSNTVTFTLSVGHLDRDGVCPGLAQVRTP